jgi:hypothetical protein
LISRQYIESISYKENIKNVLVDYIADLEECKHVTHLTFSTFFGRHIKENILPASLTHLTFGYWYNNKIELGVTSFTHLS